MEAVTDTGEIIRFGKDEERARPPKLGTGSVEPWARSFAEFRAGFKRNALTLLLAHGKIAVRCPSTYIETA